MLIFGSWSMFEVLNRNLGNMATQTTLTWRDYFEIVGCWFAQLILVSAASLLVIAFREREGGYVSQAILAIKSVCSMIFITAMFVTLPIVVVAYFLESTE